MTWIPVTESLPSTLQNVLIAYGAGRARMVLRGLYIARYTMRCVYNPDMEELEYDEETGMDYYPMGWYEATECGEHAFIGPLTGTVTHWAFMPALPEWEAQP